MSLNADPELLQDFLVEAGELLDRLDEQLIELERAPDDRELLNAVFRSFHTIKGGAGFMDVHPLVEVCHRAEDVFNMLRNGELSVDARLMDVMLRVLDTLKIMFAALREGRMPDNAEPAQLREIEALMTPGAAPAEETSVTPPASSQAAAPAVRGDAVERAYLDMLGGSESGVAAQTDPAEGQNGSGSEYITEDEFESLLDSMYGSGKGPSSEAAAQAAQSAAQASSGSPGDLITETEFEQLLDSMYGAGKGPSSEAAAAAAAAAAAVPPAQAPVVRPPQAARPASAREDSSQGHDAAKADSSKAAQATEKPESSVRVDTERLDAIMNLVGELVLVRNRLNTLKSGFEDEQVGQVIASLDMVTADLQTAVMKTRMQPIKKVFGRFPRVVRDVARMLGKEVDLVLEGEETDLDKNLVEA
ncbi:MAG: Hpt domain-containing protein, partial [Pseudomonadota bacterium]